MFTGLVFVLLDLVRFCSFVIDVRRSVDFDYKMCARRLSILPQNELAVDITDPFWGLSWRWYYRGTIVAKTGVLMRIDSDGTSLFS